MFFALVKLKVMQVYGSENQGFQDCRSGFTPRFGGTGDHIIAVRARRMEANAYLRLSLHPPGPASR